MKSYAIRIFTQFFSYSHTSLCCGIVIICCRWNINDSHVRQDYHQAIGEAVDDILHQSRTGEVSPETAAHKAHQIRNDFFSIMRRKTSPIGLLVAHSIHATARPYEYFLEKNALVMFGKPSNELSPSQAEEVVMNTINSARRPSNAVTGISRRASLLCRGIVISIAAASLSSAILSEHRLVDTARLVALGFCSAAVGDLGMAFTSTYVSWKEQ